MKKMNIHLIRIQKAIEPLRQQIANHRLYKTIECLEDLQTLMKFHVYAVWDFMSLLKSLQIGLTCTQIPWFPLGSANTRYLINEIVGGEESDVDAFGQRKSHFEIYLEAMTQCGADTREIENFLSVLKHTGNLNKAFESSDSPLAARRFVSYTFDVINNGPIHAKASAFTFGREDLIPDMFLAMINDFDARFPGQLSIFKYYLNRHIEVDGDHHSSLAIEMISELCAENEESWKTAEKVCIQALEERIELWNGAYDEIILKRKTNRSIF
jgi:hypothetical protein